MSLVFIGLFISCKDDDQNFDVLPEATQSGKNTGGALVDGKVWVAKIENVGKPSYGLENSYQYVNKQHVISIYLPSPAGATKSIWMHLALDEDIQLHKAYPLFNETDNFASIGVNDQTYFSNSEYTGNVTFTRFDNTNKIFSGTFSFKGKSSQGNIVNVTDGRFDKKFAN